MSSELDDIHPIVLLVGIFAIGLITFSIAATLGIIGTAGGALLGGFESVRNYVHSFRTHVKFETIERSR